MADTQRLRKMLLKERARLIDVDNNTSIDVEIKGDEYDISAAMDEVEMAMLQRSMGNAKLHDIDYALLRMGDGTYGICEVCNKKIPVRRLNVLPFTRTCVKCAK